MRNFAVETRSYLVNNKKFIPLAIMAVVAAMALGCRTQHTAQSTGLEEATTAEGDLVIANCSLQGVEGYGPIPQLRLTKTGDKVGIAYLELLVLQGGLGGAEDVFFGAEILDKRTSEATRGGLQRALLSWMKGDDRRSLLIDQDLSGQYTITYEAIDDKDLLAQRVGHRDAYVFECGKVKKNRPLRQFIAASMQTVMLECDWDGDARAYGAPRRVRLLRTGWTEYTLYLYQRGITQSTPTRVVAEFAVPDIQRQGNGGYDLLDLNARTLHLRIQKSGERTIATYYDNKGDEQDPVMRELGKREKHTFTCGVVNMAPEHNQ